jgi:tRNA (guanine-N7-)-methyltransferase
VEGVKKYYPHYGLPYNKGILEFSSVFHNDHPTVVEIGFGMGSSTARIAKERNEYNYLALEVFITGFAKLMCTVGEEKLENVRLMRFDAVTVLNDMIADESVAGFHVFFPDPWIKNRQKKRRLIQLPFAELLSQKLKGGGYIYCVTDWDEYARQMISVFSSVSSLSNPYGGFAPTKEWRPTTHFEEKGIRAQRQIREVWVEKI